MRISDCSSDVFSSDLDIFGYNSPLHMAVGEGNLEAVKHLIALGADINAKDGLGNTPLYKAVEKENVELARLLIDKGANIDDKDISNNTLLQDRKSVG